MILSFLKARFYFCIILISIFGLFLRFIDYDKVPPFDVTKDEFFYPWAGMTLISEGVPKAWSLFDAYPSGEIVYKWGTWYRIVSPWVEKPPLYSLLAGSWMLLNGVRDLFDVRLSILRILPISISFFTIVLVGYLGQSYFGKKVGIIAALLYATVPTIVISNRISLVENLLTPIVLLAVYFFSRFINSNFRDRFFVFLIAVLCGFSVLTKNIGVALPIVIIGVLLIKKNYKDILKIGLITLISASVHPLMGLYYDWDLFINVMKDYQKALAFAGFPEVVSTIFRFPIVAHQWDKIFPDGSMLAGFILLFSSPFWLNTKDFIMKRRDYLYAFLGFPFIYIVLLSLLESGATLYTYFGWHIYPIFPFAMILLSKVMVNFWSKLDFFQFLFIFLIIGFSTVRFFLLLNVSALELWQLILSIILAGSVLIFFLRKDYKRKLFLILFAVYLVVNVLVVFNLDRIYPGFPQPLN